MTVVEIKSETTRRGGVTGAGFVPGVSGNPGGRPKGLARTVREMVGEDGSVVAEFMLSVMGDERARTRDRLEAGNYERRGSVFVLLDQDHAKGPQRSTRLHMRVVSGRPCNLEAST